MIRQLTQNDIDQHLALTQAAFFVTFTESQLEERRKMIVPEHFWGYFIENRLAAQLAILPLRIYIQGIPFEMGGIAHVASYPELRRQGMVGKLMVNALEVMKRNGQTVSLLNPFSFSFYRKYGWEYFSEIQSFQLKMSSVPRYRDCDGYILRKKTQDWELVHKLYDTFAIRYNGMLIRSRDHWLDSVFPRKLGNLAVYYKRDDVPAGYMLYTVTDDFMKIHEFVYTDEESRRGLWQFIGNHDSKVRQLSFQTPIDDPFAYTLYEPGEGQRVHPNFMFRIVDVGSFLRQCRLLPASQEETIRVSLSDEHAAWNRGVWEISRKQDGIANIQRSFDADTADVSCDIQTFSSMMIGRVRPSKLHQLGCLGGGESGVERLERWIPGAVPFLTDMF
ncbi:GNAT family N-acetyltransferase [Cohnella pontilimi]|uniref:GNAT family N-acetyltransferase n=1 Tax=Cohnella pontilimi TaxID=2564100 RepID=A0A4U0FGJ1_9BACL|nr:GNAT family N-acetyltransferase [Cohnella pontilimi]TJY44126.1 GNAT family N-acetyltransferase [Cohnella pontilimi]